ncbi:MAG: DUF2281 domain-containing protein [Prevotellaceae bacterium]|jgi:hypothetical protein|nr:DUF2281 domain-containing protein [Prevotellaceae bacterium]
MNTLLSDDRTTRMLYNKIHRLPSKVQFELSNYVESLLRKYQVDKPEKPFFGCMKGTVTWMSDDFNAPLEDFKEYMQ